MDLTVFGSDMTHVTHESAFSKWYKKCLGAKWTKLK